jgi:DNA polymerase-3 subunit epsilon
MTIQCKQCSGYYKLRKGKFGEFYGCSNYPRCRSTMRVEEYLRAGGTAETSQAAEAPLPDRFAVFDVETPNRHNDRMSAIGIALVEGGVVTDTFFSLVDPEQSFDPFNIQLTGITPEMAAAAPTFGALWPRLESYFTGSLLVAHNATFDMGVLAKCLRAYGIAWQGSADYVCTVRMSRKCFPTLPNHKLNTLCDCLDITLDHHQADSDSCACAQVLLRCLAAGADLRQFRRTYNFCPIFT